MTCNSHRPSRSQVLLLPLLLRPDLGASLGPPVSRECPLANGPRQSHALLCCQVRKLSLGGVRGPKAEAWRGWDLCCHPAFPKGEVTGAGSFAAAPDLGQSLLTSPRTTGWLGQLTRNTATPPTRTVFGAGGVSPTPSKLLARFCWFVF